jgi:arylsulfatase A-like enzyme
LYGGGTNGPLRGSKATLFEGVFLYFDIFFHHLVYLGGTKVDAFVYSPLLGGLSGRVYEGLLHLSDWFSTILEMLNITYEPKSDYSLDGTSQYPGWRDTSTTLKSGPRQQMLYNWYSTESGIGCFAVRDYQYFG